MARRIYHSLLKLKLHHNFISHNTTITTSLFLFLSTLLLLGVTAFITGVRRLDGSSALIVTRDESREVLELLPLVVHRAAAEGERANELGESQRPLLEALLSELGEHVLACLLDRTSRVALGDVSERTELEVRLDLASSALDEDLPHEATGGVVREWEVDRLVEELFEFLLRTFLGLTRATDDGDSGLVGDPLGLPLGQRLLDPRGILGVVLLGLLLSLLLLFLGGPDLLALVDVDERRRVLFGGNHDHGDHLVTLLLLICEHSLDTQGTDVEDDRASLGRDGTHDQTLASAGGTVEEEGAHVFGESLPDEGRAQGEDDILCDQLPD